MFFAINLLLPQHGGKFATAWLAATRGIGCVKRKDVLGCNIIKLCDEILEMVLTSSTRPSLRLSLSLSSRLINGATKIYRRQVEICIEDLVAFLSLVRKPKISIDKALRDSEDISRVPVHRVQKKRKRVDINKLSDEPATVGRPSDLQQTVIEEIVVDEAELHRPSAHQIDVDLITLREETALTRPPDELGVGDLGVLEDVEFTILPPAVEHIVDPLAQLQEETPKKRKRESKGESRSIKKKALEVPETPAQVEVPKALAVEVVVEPPADVQATSTVIEVERDLPQPDRVRPDEVTRTPKKEKAAVNCAVLKIVKRRIRPINCWHLNKQKKMFPVHDYHMCPVELEPINLDKLDIHDIVASAIEGDMEIEEAPDTMRVSAKSKQSLLRSSTFSHFQSTKRTTPSQMPAVPSASEIHIPEHIPAQVSTDARIIPVPPQIVEIADVHTPAAVEEIPAVPVEEIILPRLPGEDEGLGGLIAPSMYDTPLAKSTPLSRRPLKEINVPLPERTFEVTLPPLAEAPRYVKAVVSDEATKKKTLAKERLKRVRNIIKGWNAEVQGDATIEDVCCRPVNRFNIAVAFNDLLNLHAAGYVKLNTKSDSLELGAIKKGERLLKKK